MKEALRQLTVRLPASTIAQLRQLARDHGRAIAEEIRDLLVEATEHTVELRPIDELGFAAIQLARQQLGWDPEALRKRVNALRERHREIEERLDGLGERDTDYRLALIDDLKRVEEEIEEGATALRRWAEVLARARARVAVEAIRPVAEFFEGIADDVAEILNWFMDLAGWLGDPGISSVAWGSFRERIRRRISRPSPVPASFGKSGDIFGDLSRLCPQLRDI